MKKMIIEVSELENTLAEHCALDCRFSLMDTAQGQQQYQQGHIPGAFYIDLDKHLSGEKLAGLGRHPLPELPDLAKTLASLGISKSSSIVVYDDNKLSYACRAWWLLTAVGFEKVRILNGGYTAWQQGQGKIEIQAPAPLTNTVKEESLSWQQTIFNYSDVCSAIKTNAITLVDSREESRYRGEQEPIDPIAGHIPTAINKVWGDVTDQKGFIKDDSFHLQRWSDIATDKPLVIYCGSGVTACVNILSAQLAGKEAILYAGSWSDWCNRPGAEIATEKNST